MAYPSGRTETARHARLFELIRQDNVIKETDMAKPPRQTTPDLAEMQRFLKRAEQSLRSGQDD